MKISILLLSLSLAITGMTQAQKISDPQPFAAAIKAANLQKHLYVVAGKDFEGRETATEGQRKAAMYIEENFRSLGLLPGNKDSYQLPYPVFQDSLLRAAIEVNGVSYLPDQDFAVNPSSDYTSIMRGSEVVFAGYGLS